MFIAGPLPTLRIDQPASWVYSKTRTGLIDVTADLEDKLYDSPNETTENANATTDVYCFQSKGSPVSDA